MWYIQTGNVEPRNITVRVPVGTRFKGMGKPKRMKSKREQAISQAGKKRRQCKNCLEYGHNVRTCKNPKRVEKYGEDDTSAESEQDGGFWWGAWQSVRGGGRQRSRVIRYYHQVSFFNHMFWYNVVCFLWLVLCVFDLKWCVLDWIVGMGRRFVRG